MSAKAFSGLPNHRRECVAYWRIPLRKSRSPRCGSPHGPRPRVPASRSCLCQLPHRLIATISFAPSSPSCMKRSYALRRKTSSVSPASRSSSTSPTQQIGIAQPPMRLSAEDSPYHRSRQVLPPFRMADDHVRHAQRQQLPADVSPVNAPSSFQCTFCPRSRRSIPCSIKRRRQVQKWRAHHDLVATMPGNERQKSRKSCESGPESYTSSNWRPLLLF